MDDVVDEDLSSLSDPPSEAFKEVCKPINPVSDVSNSENSNKSVKRPANPFILWSKEERKKIMAEGVIPKSVVSKELGQRWKNLPDDVKEQYVIEADKLRWEFLQQYPDMKFQRMKAPKLKKFKVCKVNPVKTVVKKTKLSKKSPSCSFDPRASAIPVNKQLPSVLKPSTIKTLSSSSVPQNTDSEYKIQFKIDENFSSDFDSVLDKSLQSSKVHKFLKLRPDKTVEILQTSPSIEDLPTVCDVCGIALKSRDCVQTFDYVSDIVLQKAGNLTDMVFDIVKEYNDFFFSQKELVPPLFDSPDYVVPKMSELIGNEWMLPNMGFEHLP